jgi:hypothetical protein
MRRTLFATAALLALADPASAEDCDYYLNALIGTKCAGTLSAGFTDGWSRATQRLDATSYTFRAQSTSNTGIASVGITPTNWLSIGVSTSRTSSTVSTTFADTFGYTANSSSSSDGWGRQAIVANAKLLDTGPSSSSRMVANIYMGGGYLPARLGYSVDKNIYGGATVAAQWKLGATPYSIDIQLGNQLDHSTSTGKTYYYPTARVLLSNDQLGIGIGPTVQATVALDGFPADNNLAIYQAGLTAIAQPFRTSSAPLLSGLILSSSVTHSIGQASFLPTDRVGRVETISVTGSATFHIKY